MNDARTPLRRDLMCLRLIVAEAVRLHPGRAPSDRVVLGVLRDYLMWLTIDAMRDEALACCLVPTLAKLQVEFHAEAESRRARDMDPTAPAFYGGFLHALEQILSFKYGVDLLLDEEINRREFL